MSEQTQTQDSGVDIQTLRKGLNDSLSNLNGLLSSPTSVLAKAKHGTMDTSSGEENMDTFADESYHAPATKAKKKKAAEPMNKNEDYDEDDMGDEEDDEDEGQRMSKSLADMIADDDPEAEVAMDVEPFLKSLVKSMDRKFAAMERSITGLTQLSKAVAQVTSFSAELQKAVGDQPLPRQGVTSAADLSTRTRFAKSKDELGYDGGQVLRKSLELLKSNQIDLNQAAKIEGRVNAGQPLPKEVAHLFENK